MSSTSPLPAAAAASAPRPEADVAAAVDDGDTPALFPSAAAPLTPSPDTPKQHPLAVPPVGPLEALQPLPDTPSALQLTPVKPAPLPVPKPVLAPAPAPAPVPMPAPAQMPAPAPQAPISQAPVIKAMEALTLSDQTLPAQYPRSEAQVIAAAAKAAVAVAVAAAGAAAAPDAAPADAAAPAAAPADAAAPAAPASAAAPAAAAVARPFLGRAGVRAAGAAQSAPAAAGAGAGAVRGTAFSASAFTIPVEPLPAVLVGKVDRLLVATPDQLTDTGPRGRMFGFLTVERKGALVFRETPPAVIAYDARCPDMRAQYDHYYTSAVVAPRAFGTPMKLRERIILTHAKGSGNDAYAFLAQHDAVYSAPDVKDLPGLLNHGSTRIKTGITSGHCVGDPTCVIRVLGESGPVSTSEMGTVLLGRVIAGLRLQPSAVGRFIGSSGQYCAREVGDDGVPYYAVVTGKKKKLYGKSGLDKEMLYVRTQVGDALSSTSVHPSIYGAFDPTHPEILRMKAAVKDHASNRVLVKFNREEFCSFILPQHCASRMDGVGKLTNAEPCHTEILKTEPHADAHDISAGEKGRKGYGFLQPPKPRSAKPKRRANASAPAPAPASASAIAVSDSDDDDARTDTDADASDDDAPATTASTYVEEMIKSAGHSKPPAAPVPAVAAARSDKDEKLPAAAAAHLHPDVVAACDHTANQIIRAVAAAEAAKGPIDRREGMEHMFALIARIVKLKHQKPLITLMEELAKPKIDDRVTELLGQLGTVVVDDKTLKDVKGKILQAKKVAGAKRKAQEPSGNGEAPATQPKGKSTSPFLN